MVIQRLFGYFKNTLMLAVTIMGLISNIAYALDNPNAPDYIAEFNARSQVHEQMVNDPKLTNRGILAAYNSYQLFLDEELDAAYQLLRSKLLKAQLDELKKSQEYWIKFRDAEFEFINNNWTRANFGGSFGLSRGGYRTNIIKNRVTQILYYAMNY